jgi:hypothetical protein
MPVVDNTKKSHHTKQKDFEAQRRDLIYYSKSYSVNLILTYKYIVFNVVGKSKRMKKYSLELINVE